MVCIYIINFGFKKLTFFTTYHRIIISVIKLMMNWLLDVISVV